MRHPLLFFFLVQSSLTMIRNECLLSLYMPCVHVLHNAALTPPLHLGARLWQTCPDATPTGAHEGCSERTH
jgi:hypothetical protein